MIYRKKCIKFIVLVGLMGVGKLIVGCWLVIEFKLFFVDVDDEIEKVVGLLILEIF